MIDFTLEELEILTDLVHRDCPDEDDDRHHTLVLYQLHDKLLRATGYDN